MSFPVNLSMKPAASAPGDIAGTFRGRTENLERMMLALPQAEIPVAHDFGGGMCARTIRIPAGTCLIGAIHLQPQINIMQGDITILTEEGERRLTGYHVVSSPAGVRRVGYAHADTCWTTVLKTDETDPKSIEDNLTAARFDDPRLIEMRNDVQNKIGNERENDMQKRNLTLEEN